MTEKDCIGHDVAVIILNYKTWQETLDEIRMMCRFRISQCAISANLGVHIPVVMMCSFR